MSVGRSFLRAVVENGSRGLLQELNREWLLEDERAAYDFIVDHMRRYGQLPSVEAINENGHGLTRGREPAAYYLNRIRKRAVFNTISETHPTLVTAMEAQNIEGAGTALQSMLFATRHIMNSNMVTSLAQEAGLLRDRMEVRMRQSGLIGVTSGFPTVDKLTNGYQPEDVILIVGRPHTGKSWVLLHSAREAWLSGASVLVVTMEMSSQQLATRFVGLDTGINPNSIRDAQISSHARSTFYSRIDGIADRPPIYFLRGTRQKTLGDIDAIIQELEPDIVYIDAGYLLKPDGNRRHASRRELIADVIEGIKDVAANRHKPIVISVQFNREVAKKGKGELDLAMLGETDAMGQIASVVLGLRPGEGIFTDIRRRVDMMKNREGMKAKFEIGFQFAPMFFGEIIGGGKGIGHNGGPEFTPEDWED